jgi:hypothetical protein
MSANTWANTWIAAAAVAVVIAPALCCAEVPTGAGQRTENQQLWTRNPMSGAYAATNKSRRATRPASRGRVSQAADPSIRVTAPGGRDLGTDPDATIRFQLRRDSSMGGM